MTKNKGRSSLLEREQGTILKHAPKVVVLGYPAPYGVGVSSLGAQTVYRIWNEIPGLACERLFTVKKNQPLPRPLVSLESGQKVGNASAIAFSVSCETDLLGVVELLNAAGIASLAEDRDDSSPPIVIGGPITMLDPALVAPLGDVVVVGEAEQSLEKIGEALVSTDEKQDLLETLRSENGIWIPGTRDAPPYPTETPLDLLPAFAATWSPDAELTNLFLVEATRGCKRGCDFCVLSCRAQSRPRFRAIEPKSILDVIPENAPGVGLVGAAVTDHPEIESVVQAIVNRGKRVSLSSIRADRLTESLARELKRGGLRTLTVAADGCSDTLRRSIHKGITSTHIKEAAGIARTIGIRGIKIYTMVGLPEETDDDISSFSDLMLEIKHSLRVSVAAQAFVPKPGTPIGQAEMADETTIRKRLALLRRLTKGKIRILPTSARWSWVDWKLAHAKEKAALVAIEASRSGGGYTALKTAIAKYCL